VLTDFDWCLTQQEMSINIVQSQTFKTDKTKIKEWKTMKSFLKIVKIKSKLEKTKTEKINSWKKEATKKIGLETGFFSQQVFSW